MSNRKLFGTDGIRGKANIYPMTSEIATSLGRAVTYYFQLTHQVNKTPVIVVGKDTRLSCYMLEMAFASGVCSQGGRVILTGPLPTPAVAFVTKSLRAEAGVMISASHNSYEDNGIKIFDSTGNKLPDSVEEEIEKLVLNPHLIPTLTGENLGRAKRLDEVFGRYMVHAKSAIKDNIDFYGIKVVLDCSHGAGYKVGPIMYSELGAETIVIGNRPDGTNINFKCGSLYPEKACAAVKEHKADLGICLDGDGDRLTVIDENGESIDGDRLIAFYAKLLLDQNILNEGDTVVGTVMSNLGLENYLKSIGLKFHRTKVGDRYICEYMRKNGCLLGGEPSGHIIFSEHATTGDGCVAGLKLIEGMKFYNKPLSKCVEGISLYPHILKNISVDKKPPLTEIEKLQSAIEKAEQKLAGKGRTLIRYSGTENLARVMVEGEDLDIVKEVCDMLVSVVSEELCS